MDYFDQIVKAAYNKNHNSMQQILKECASVDIFRSKNSIDMRQFGEAHLFNFGLTPAASLVCNSKANIAFWLVDNYGANPNFMHWSAKHLTLINAKNKYDVEFLEQKYGTNIEHIHSIYCSYHEGAKQSPNVFNAIMGNLTNVASKNPKFLYFAAFGGHFNAIMKHINNIKKSNYAPIINGFAHGGHVHCIERFFLEKGLIHHVKMETCNPSNLTTGVSYYATLLYALSSDLVSDERVIHFLSFLENDSFRDKLYSLSKMIDKNIGNIKQDPELSLFSSKNFEQAKIFNSEKKKRNGTFSPPLKPDYRFFHPKRYNRPDKKEQRKSIFSSTFRDIDFGELRSQAVFLERKMASSNIHESNYMVSPNDATDANFKKIKDEILKSLNEKLQPNFFHTNIRSRAQSFQKKIYNLKTMLGLKKGFKEELKYVKKLTKISLLKRRYKYPLYLKFLEHWLSKIEEGY